MPAKIKNEVWDEIIKYIESGLTFRDAYELAGISNYSFYTKIKQDSNYYNSIKRALVKFKQYHLNKIRKDESWQSSAWILERKFKDEFARLEQIESKEVSEFDNMTDSELDEEIKKCEQGTKNKKIKIIKGTPPAISAN